MEGHSVADAAGVEVAGAESDGADGRTVLQAKVRKPVCPLASATGFTTNVFCVD